MDSKVKHKNIKSERQFRSLVFDDYFKSKNISWEQEIKRKNLLVPQDIRERKGSFFTPQIWVEKSQEYIADVFGKNWQDNYYVWDCCAGTGNLLVGINRKLENVFASAIDESDVKAMYDRIDNGARFKKKCFSV